MELSTKTKERLSKVSTATLCTQLFKRGFRNVYIQGIKRLTSRRAATSSVPRSRCAASRRARTWTRSARSTIPNHPQRKAIESVPPGHVLVLDCRSEKRVASGGEILTTRLKVRGAAGLVSDGPVRDSGSLSQMDFPIYCAGGSAPLNLLYHHAIDQNVPIGCGGVAVYPGDVIVGDDEGVVVIPQHLADEVAEACEEQEKMEAFILERVQGGAKLAGTYPPNDDTKAAFAEWRKAKGI